MLHNQFLKRQGSGAGGEARKKVFTPLLHSASPSDSSLSSTIRGREFVSGSRPSKSILEMHQKYGMTWRPIIIRAGKHCGYGKEWN